MSVPNINAFLHYYSAAPPPNLPQAAKEKYAAKRAFYACATSNGYDYLNYTNTGSKHKQDYVEYSGNNEKSTGAFSAGGLLSTREKKDIKKQLRETKSVIWDLVISCEEYFGKAYCNDFEQAYTAIKSVLPRFFKRAGLNPNNVEWYAGLHQNTDNRHIHVSFWEKEPKRYRQNKAGLFYSEGHVPQACINFLKAAMEMKLTDMSAELRALRKDLTEKPLPANVRFNEKLRVIIRNIPKSGRLGYASDNMAHLRAEIDNAINIVLQSAPELNRTFEKFSSAATSRDIRVREILLRDKIPQREWAKYLVADRCIDDLYRRLGNQVINAALAFRSGEVSARGYRVRERIERERESRLAEYSARLMLSIKIEAIHAFDEYMKELEQERERAHEME